MIMNKDLIVQEPVFDFNEIDEDSIVAYRRQVHEEAWSKVTLGYVHSYSNDCVEIISLANGYKTNIYVVEITEGRAQLAVINEEFDSFVESIEKEMDSDDKE